MAAGSKDLERLFSPGWSLLTGRFYRGTPRSAGTGTSGRKGPGGVHAVLEHLRVADLVGQQQDQPRIEQRRLLLAQALVRIQQLLVEAVCILQVQLRLHAPCSSSSAAPSAWPTACTSAASTVSPVAAT